MTPYRLVQLARTLPFSVGLLLDRFELRDDAGELAARVASTHSSWGGRFRRVGGLRYESPSGWTGEARPASTLLCHRLAVVSRNEAILGSLEAPVLTWGYTIRGTAPGLLNPFHFKARARRVQGSASGGGSFEARREFFGVAGGVVRYRVDLHPDFEEAARAVVVLALAWAVLRFRV